MQLNILEIKELESGGAELIIDIDDETKKYLLNYAILEIFKRGLYEVKGLYDED